MAFVDLACNETLLSRQAEGYNEKSKLKTNKFVEMGGKNKAIWMEPDVRRPSLTSASSHA
jgi:hypothetical protein